jgi:hypothetical protein
MFRLINSASIAGIVGAVLGFGLAWINVPSSRWERRFNANKRNFRFLEKLESEHYGRRSSGPLYAYVSLLSLQDNTLNTQSIQRLIARIEKVANHMTKSELEPGCATALNWATEVGTFARSANQKRGFPLRSFLQTNHLAVIRDAALAEPFLLWQLSTQRPQMDGEDRELVCWALALASLARSYNSTARQQREAVSFERKPPDFIDHGEIVRSPSVYSRPFLNIRDVMSPRFRLRRRRFQSSSQRLTALTNDVRAKNVFPA